MDTITTAVETVTIDSNRIIHETEADLVTRKIPNVLRLVQYDMTLPVIAVSLKKAGVEYALPSGAACNIRLKKPDGTVVYNPAYGCDSTRKIVYFEVTVQMAIVEGELNPTIEVVVGGKVAGTSPLRIIVDRNPVQIDDYESTDEMKTIEQYIEAAQEARDQSVAAAEESESWSGVSETWAGESQDWSEKSEAWAIGEKGGVPVTSADQTYHNNSKWYRDLALQAYHDCLISLQTVQTYIVLIKILIGTAYLTTEDSYVLNTESGDKLVLDL